MKVYCPVGKETFDHAEIEDPHSLAQDATEWKCVVNSKHEGGVLLRIKDADQTERALPPTVENPFRPPRKACCNVSSPRWPEGNAMGLIPVHAELTA